MDEWTLLEHVLIYRILGEETVGRDCGNDVAGWFNQYFGGTEYRLVYASPDLPRRKLCESGKTKFHEKARPEYKVK